MSERRKRYRKPKDDKRCTDLSSHFKDLEVQPKILLKTKCESKADGEMATTSKYTSAEQGGGGQALQKTIIFQKAAYTSPASSPNTTRESSGISSEICVPPNIIEPVHQMTRPATVISSTGSINIGVKKLLMKSNTDFLVIGVVGTQGVGKSTLLNLLANEQINYNYYKKVFVEEDSIFPTKLKVKCSARSRTESTHMYITSDRMILLDTPPVLSNAYKKDMTNNELEDLSSVILLMSVCHLLVVVQDDYFNLNFINLLRFAELMKPSQEAKSFLQDYFPNVLFVKNKAKRLDFAADSVACQDEMYKAFFKDSQLRIYKGQVTENHVKQQQLSQIPNRKKSRAAEVVTPINTFLMPEVKSPLATSYHDSLNDLIRQFRSIVFMTPRNPMYSGTVELTEEMWFDCLTKVSQDNHNFFFNTYENIKRKHLDVDVVSEKPKVGSSGKCPNSSKDILENWRE